MNILQINTVYAEGSTGKIVMELSRVCKENGIENRAAVRCADKQTGVMEISGRTDSRIHGKLAQYTMHKGCFSYRRTKRFLKKVDKDRPDIIHLHNLHGSYVNIGLLMDYAKRNDIPVVFTLHDCWAFTAICPHFGIVNCDRWQTGCGNCPQRKKYYHYTERIEDCPISFIANGDTARLKRLRRVEEFYGFRFATATLSFGDYDDTEIECKVLLDTLHSESPSLTREESERLFREVEKDYLDVKSKIKRLQEIRENDYYNALQIKFAYAVTCHKAQGGQWKAVFIDKFLFGDEPMSRDMMRWLYTAMTRATERLYFVNFDERFFEE